MTKTRLSGVYTLTVVWLRSVNLGIAWHGGAQR